MTLFVAAGLLLIATGAGRAQDHPCQAAVEQALAVHGIKLSEVKVFGWRTDYFAAEHGGDGPIDGYRFYGRPPSCHDGEISIDLNSECWVNDVYTHGDCRVKGMAHFWW
jgi:hypothetical protein